MEILESAGSMFFRDHLGIGGNGEVFGDEGMLVYLAAEDQGEFDGAADELIPFQLRLPTGDVATTTPRTVSMPGNGACLPDATLPTTRSLRSVRL
jgi:hypothetical protein